MMCFAALPPLMLPRFGVPNSISRQYVGPPPDGAACPRA